MALASLEHSEPARVVRCQRGCSQTPGMHYGAEGVGIPDMKLDVVPVKLSHKSAVDGCMGVDAERPGLRSYHTLHELFDSMASLLRLSVAHIVCEP